MTKNLRLESKQLPESLVQALANRDAALWIGENADASETDIEAIAKFIGLPWRLVLCESNDARLVAALDARNSQGESLARTRGFIHLVASDPEGLQLPPRALPVFLLKGRSNAAQPEESPNLGAFGNTRRRLNMINELIVARPRVVVLVGSGGNQPLADFFTIWEEERFRSLVVLLSTASQDIQRIDAWLNTSNAAPAVDHCYTPFSEAVSFLTRRLTVELPEARQVIRIRDDKGNLSELDVTDCDLVERPLLGGYELIKAGDLRLLQPDELSREDIEQFFSRSTESWKPYAAGLPWRRGRGVDRKLLEILKTVATAGPEENCVLTVNSESGAGGTTFVRMLAFEAALQGFPTLVARPGLVQPQPLELSGFLHRIHVRAVEHATAKAQLQQKEVVGLERFETPSLVVYDVNHWEGKQSELRSFLKAITHEGRPVVILVVSGPFAPVDLTEKSRGSRLIFLTHELSLQEALRLGEHLNRYLRPFGEARSSDEWREFWQAHQPDNMTLTIAHFWIALEFWLKRQFDLSQSIQSWLYDSFKKASIADDMRLLLLEIAALSIERQPLPEGLMPLSPRHKYPYSVLLEEVRIAVPALALVRETTDSHKIWAMAHDLFARYFITSTFFDHTMMERLGLTDATDPVHLRLLLLRKITSRSPLSLKPFRELALNFVIKILKLDTVGNQEFIPYWREVLDILMKMPASLRETSRVFNHHVAISLRRIVKYKELDIPLDEQKNLLDRAIRHLEYALNELDPEALEPNLNLYTSLALAYQDLADVEREMGAAPERIQSLRTKATDATRKALQEDPTDSYVLETTAKNLIQNGELYPEHAAVSGTEALGYIYQAITLERSESRQTELTKLANRSLQLLRSANGAKQARQLAKAGNPLGSLAEAWLLLTEGIADLSECDMAHMPARNVSNALAVLESAPEKSNWMILRFRYDLISLSRSQDFASQLRLLDELAGTGYRMPLQIELEYAILLHQEHRHAEASRRFRNLRHNLRRFDAIVEVPSRLFWLRANEQGSRRICSAQVVESRGQRSVAKVRELKEEVVPFIPQEFGVEQMRPGTKFTCCVTFGRNGPFLKPPQVGTPSQ